MRRVVLHVAIVAALSALVSSLSISADALNPPIWLIGGYSSGPETSVQFGRLNYVVDTTNSDQTQANRWPFEVLQRGYSSQVESIARAEADGAPMTFLFYADPMVIRPSDPAGYTTALPAPEVRKDHPDWLLRDSTGAVLTRSDGNGDEMVDPGNVAYQKAAAAHLISVADDEGWDGVMLDEVNQTWQWTMARQPANYPTVTAWDNAELSFVRNVCGQLNAVGKLCVTNTGDYASDARFWTQVTDANSGSMQEFYVALDTALGNDPSVATIENGWWQPSENRLITSQNAGKNSIFHAYAANAAEVRYALGSYLLAWRGYGTFAASTDYYGDTDAWSSDFTMAKSFGTPVGTYRSAGELLWRQFEHGYVVVNPHSTTQSAVINGKQATLAPATAELVAS